MSVSKPNASDAKPCDRKIPSVYNLTYAMMKGYHGAILKIRAIFWLNYLCLYDASITMRFIRLKQVFP